MLSMAYIRMILWQELRNCYNKYKEFEKISKELLKAIEKL